MESYKTPVKKIKQRLEPLKIPASPLLQRLGFGTGVNVYKLNRSPRCNVHQSPWALKKLSQTTKLKMKSELGDRIKEEAGILRKLRHPNIVGFRAFFEMGENNPCLAMEECSMSLGEDIEGRYEDGLSYYPSAKILKVLGDISTALDYLHNEALILHADIKSYNILIKDDFVVCKLCDFGVCMPLDEKGICTGSDEYIGSPPWCPPEVLRCEQVVTDKADIYALGLVIWEMLALEVPPVPDDNDTSDDEVIDDDDEDEKVVRPDLPDVTLNDDYNLVLELYHRCTEFNFNDRPSAAILCSMVRGVKCTKEL